MAYMGDFATSARVDCHSVVMCDTTGAPSAVTSGSACCRRQGQTTLAPAGVVLTSSGGNYYVTVFTASASSYFIAGFDYDCFFGNGTISSTSVIGYPLGSFSIVNRPVQSLANSIIATTTFAAGAIDSAALAASAGQEIADAVLLRDLATGSSASDRNVQNALRALRNKTGISGTTLTVTEEDDTTPAWTAVITTSASLNPISEVDPA